MVRMPEPLLFFPDHSADPIWAVSDGAMIDLEALPLTEPARVAARYWATRWDRMASAEHLHEDEPAPTEAEWEQLDRDGRAVWQRLQHELAPEWPLGWVTFSGGSRHVQWEPDGPVEPL